MSKTDTDTVHLTEHVRHSQGFKHVVFSKRITKTQQKTKTRVDPKPAQDQEFRTYKLTRKQKI